MENIKINKSFTGWILDFKNENKTYLMKYFFDFTFIKAFFAFILHPVVKLSFFSSHTRWNWTLQLIQMGTLLGKPKFYW